MRDCAPVIAANTLALSEACYRAGLAWLGSRRVCMFVYVCVCVCARAREAAADDVGFKTLRARAEERRAEIARRRKIGGSMWLLWCASPPSLPRPPVSLCCLNADRSRKVN